MNKTGIISQTQQEGTEGSFSEIDVFQPVQLANPQVGDVGVVINDIFYPAISGKPSVNDIVITAEAKTDTDTSKYCMTLEDVQVVPPMSPELTEIQINKITNVDNTKEFYTGRIPLYVISDVPTEASPEFESNDKLDPGYIENQGISFYSPSHKEYDLEKFDPLDGVGYIYGCNEDVCFPPEIYAEQFPAFLAAYETAQTATAEAYQQYSTASYTLRSPAVYQAQSEARQAAYDESYNAARAELTAAENALEEIKSQRDAAAQAKYDEVAADYAEQIAAAQEEESQAQQAAFELEQGVEAACQAAYDQVIADSGTEEEAQAASDAEREIQNAAVQEAYNLWYQKSDALMMLQWESYDAAQQAYYAEYNNWQPQVDAAQAILDAVDFDQTQAEADATEAGNAAAAEYDDALEAAQEYDNNTIPQYKAADYRAWLDAKDTERIAKLKFLQSQYMTNSSIAPNPTLRCPPTDIAYYHPLWTNPDFPVAQNGTVWDGKPFVPEERILHTNWAPGYYELPFIFMMVRTFKKGRLLGRPKRFTVLRLPGKVIVDYDKASRILKVTTPYSNWVKISAEYLSGGHLFTDQLHEGEGVVNADGTINITFKADNPLADIHVQKYVKPISVSIDVLGENLTESFAKTYWNKMPERGQPQTKQVALRLSTKADLYLTPDGTGDGLTPETPGSWDSILTPVALLGNTSDAALALRDKVVWLSGNPITSQDTFKIPYGALTIIGGFNSDFTAVTGYSHLNKKTEMPGYTTLENFKATAPNIFALGYGSASGTFRNCVLDCEDYEDDSETLYLWSGHSITLEKCTINYSGLSACIYMPYGYIRNCRITSTKGLAAICANIHNSTVNISGVSKFVTYYGLGAVNHNGINGTNTGICELFPTDSHVHNWLDDLIYKQVNINYTIESFTKKEALGSISGTYPVTKYFGENTYYPAKETPSIKNSILNINLIDGADGEDGANSSAGGTGQNGECVCCSIAAVAVDSEIHIKAAKAGDGGNGGNGSSDRAGRGGRGGDCLIILPAKLRNTTITLTGGEVGLKGYHGTSNREAYQGEFPAGYPSWARTLTLKNHHGTINGKDGRFYIKRPLYWSNSSFPAYPQDDLQPKYCLADGYVYSDYNGNYSWKPIETKNHITYIGKTALPSYWSENGVDGLNGSHSYQTEDGYIVPVKWYFGSDGGIAGNGCPFGGNAGTGGLGGVVAGQSGMDGIQAGDYLE